jgi:hypothetical protein
VAACHRPADSRRQSPYQMRPSSDPSNPVVLVGDVNRAIGSDRSPRGTFSGLDCVSRPSPEKPALPVPAIVTIVPLASTFALCWHYGRNITVPSRATATPPRELGIDSETAFAGFVPPPAMVVSVPASKRRSRSISTMKP